MPPASRSPTRPILARTGSADVAHARSWARSPAPSPAGGGGTSRPESDSGGFPSLSSFPSSRADDWRGPRAGDAGSSRQRRWITRPVRFSSDDSRAIRPSDSSRLSDRWTVPGLRPTRTPIERSEGQHAALERAQNRSESKTLTSVGVKRGSEAMSCGNCANGTILLCAAAASGSLRDTMAPSP